ncbi:hypothetical protein LTR08_003415 [Meristemomyces frigidus]|nr:hypothetical protein LTR08_003415 [Meristemomyces frigidus]
MSIIATASSLEGVHTHALQMSRSDHPATGFTAVNGDRQSAISFRPDETGKASSNDQKQVKQLLSGNDPSSALFHSHGWRPDRISYPAQYAAPEPKKRKRSDSAEDEAAGAVPSTQSYNNDCGSPKRRVMKLDTVVGANSPATTSQASPAFQTEQRLREPMPIGLYSHERSPTARWNRGQPPPPPRPEIEAGLAESLQRELHSAQQAQLQAQAQAQAQAQEAEAQAHQVQAQAQAQAEAEAQATADAQAHAEIDNHIRPGDEALSPSVESYNLRMRQSYSPDQDDLDSKKRKRNFSNRTKTGCHTCRGRKKKCDERKPACLNCERGNFACGGYGAKPPGGFKQAGASAKMPVTLQSKPPYEPAHGPTGYYPSPVDEPGRSYSHWGRLPPEPEAQTLPTMDPRRGSWPKPAVWPAAEPPSTYMPPRLPPTDMNHIPPLHVFPPMHHPLPPLDPWADPHSALPSYRPQTNPGQVVSSHNSGSTTSSQRTAALALSYNSNAQLTEKEKMLLGRPFLHFGDGPLLIDRQHCKGALERYNDAARSTSHVSSEERARFFRAIVDPTARPEYKRRDEAYTGPEYGRRDEVYTGPQGHVGHGSLVDSPFTCEYGYNIHIGDEVVMQSNCYMQDACEIRIGNRTIIGPNVKFYGMTASVDAKARKGSRGTFQGGAIKIGEDCFIGGDVIILPFRKIGNGAVVGAGSVVTKDVKENTVVAGNPAKVIRRIEPGPNIDRHHPDIQEQNDKMLEDMWESAKRGPER